MPITKKKITKDNHFYCNIMKLTVLVVIIYLYNNILVFGLKPCPTISLKNGSVKYRSRGRIARFRCNRGFVLDGENYGGCIRGEWDVDIPKCVYRSQCSPFTEIRNGNVIANKQWTLLVFTCNKGFHLIGPSMLQCNNSTWNAHPPKCESNLPISCTFEDNGICGWDNSTKSGYFWLKRQFATPSHYLNTGPGHDHTLHPKNDGHYLYIETSGLQEKDLKTSIARLYSPLFPPAENNTTCFIFWYHMYGATIGELLIYIDGHKVFHKSGNQGNRWIKGIVKNLPTDSLFQITIEGIPGHGYTGDIAIDDLNITNSEECTRSNIIEDTTCDGRCYEEEALNSTLCLCNEKCLASSTCCSDFLQVCNGDTTTKGLPLSTLLNEDETTSITNEDLLESTTSKESSPDFIDTKTDSDKPVQNLITESSATDSKYLTVSYSISVSDSVTDTYVETTLSKEENSTLSISEHTKINQTLPTEINILGGNKSSAIDLLFSAIPTKAYTPDIALDTSKINSDKQNLVISAASNHSAIENDRLQPEITSSEPKLTSSTANILTIPSANRTTLAPHTHFYNYRNLSLTTKPTRHLVNETVSSNTLTNSDMLKVVTSSKSTIAKSSTLALLPNRTTMPTTRIPTTRTTTTRIPTTRTTTARTPTTRTTTTRIPTTRTTTTRTPSPTTRIPTTTTRIPTTTTTPTTTRISTTRTTTTRTPSPTTRIPTTTTRIPTTSTRIPTTDLVTSKSSFLKNTQKMSKTDHSLNFHTTQYDANTEPLSTIRFELLAETGSPRWKSIYQPKGYYTYSAIKLEGSDTGFKSASIIVIILASLIVSASIGLYVYRRRNFLNTNDVEEADVLFIPTDEMLDFSISRPHSNLHRKEEMNKATL